MADMYLLTGCPGSGKTTFAKRFAASRGLRYIGIDDFYRYINGDDVVRAHKFEVWMSFYKTIHLAEQDGVDIVVDVNAPNIFDRTEFLNWFPSYTHRLVWVDADQELCRDNNQRRRRMIPEEDMEKLLSSYEKPDWKHTEDRWESVLYVRNDNNRGFAVLTLKGDNI